MKGNIRFRIEQRSTKAKDKSPILGDVTFAGKRKWIRTGFHVEPSKWDSKKGKVKVNSVGYLGDIPMPGNAINNLLAMAQARIAEYFLGTNQPDFDEIKKIVSDVLNKKFQAKKEDTLFDFYFDRYTKEQELSEKSISKARLSVKYLLDLNDDTISLESFNAEHLRNMEQSMKAEQKSRNYIVGLLRRIRAYWYFVRKIRPELPKVFDGFSIPVEKYGTPIVLSREERDKLAQTPMPSRSLELQRDRFIFQCYVGARFGDLVKFTLDNLVQNEDGYQLEYSPTKTQKTTPKTLRIPLKPEAYTLATKYVTPEGFLFPPITEPAFNRTLKTIFTIAGLTRPVNVYNSRTGTHEIKPLNKIAASHLARRTFIQALYGRVPEAIICSMTGHSTNSKAFSRYYASTDDLRKQAISIL